MDDFISQEVREVYELLQAETLDRYIQAGYAPIPTGLSVPIFTEALRLALKHHHKSPPVELPVHLL